MLIDDVTIKVQAGRGGAGAVSFNKNRMMLGPTGGNGGHGGSVIFEGIPDLGALEHFRYQKELKAENGGSGHGQFVDGPDGQDLILKIPVGTVIHNLDSGFDYEIVKIGELVTVAKGGYGGKGNYKFRSPINTTPKQAQPGLPGDAFNLRLELKLIADIGLIGLPNVGKSTLLNTLTNAKAKVANYQFTTLEPNLGVYFGLILADIPGLIEGASTGKGLGIKFLRHVERTKALFHLVAADSEDIAQDYKIIRQELASYNKALLTKPEYLFITKIDTVSAEKNKELLKIAKKLNKNSGAISILDDQSLNTVKKFLNELEKEKIQL